ncbi:MAG: hypothetical protein QXX68_01230 [Candidatus Pacearchaeota archaeon]
MVKFRYFLFLPYLIFLGMLFYTIFIYEEKSASSFLSGKAMGTAAIIMIAFYYTIFLLVVYILKKTIGFLMKNKKELKD